MNIKDRIKQSAKEKFCYYGFKNVRTDDFAKSVGISKKTLYEHYASKEALFEEIFEEAVEREHKLIEESISRLKEIDGDAFIEELENIFLHNSKSKTNYSKDFFRDLKIYFPKLWNKVISLREEEFKKSFYMIWDKGIENGIFRKDINKQVAFLIQYEAINNLMQPENLMEISGTANEIISQVFEILLAGCLTPVSARKFLEKRADVESNNYK